MAFSFLPKEDQYFSLFSQMSTKIQEAANILVEMMHGPYENYETLSKKIKSQWPASPNQCNNSLPTTYKTHKRLSLHSKKA